MRKFVRGARYDGRMRRETYSSLKAASGAWRVAMGYMHRRPIDVLGQTCPECGGALDLKGKWEDGRVVCQGCATRVDVPGYVVAALARRREISRDGRHLSTYWEPGEQRQTKKAANDDLAIGLIVGSVFGALVLIVIVVAAMTGLGGR